MDGLFLGGYYNECIDTFHTIQSNNQQRILKDETPVKIQYTAFSAVLRSYCKLYQEEGVSSIRAQMERDVYKSMYESLLDRMTMERRAGA